MATVHQYRIESSGTVNDLEFRVRAAMVDGWKCVGGVAVLIINTKVMHYQYSQALTREPDYNSLDLVCTHDWVSVPETVNGVTPNWLPLWRCARCGVYRRANVSSVKGG